MKHGYPKKLQWVRGAAVCLAALMLAAQLHELLPLLVASRAHAGQLENEPRVPGQPAKDPCALCVLVNATTLTPVVVALEPPKHEPVHEEAVTLTFYWADCTHTPQSHRGPPSLNNA